MGEKGSSRLQSDQERGGTATGVEYNERLKSIMMIEELSDREVAAFNSENTGNVHCRRLYVSEIAFDAKIRAVLGEDEENR